MWLAVGIPVLVAAVGLVGLAASRAVATTALPYYSESTFTPAWTPVAHRVRPFAMFDQTGSRVTDRDFAGRPYVASFIYTRCSVICPQLVSGLKKVDQRVRDPRLVILSFSVTPDLDPPSVLAVFGRDRGIDPRRWKLLTGRKADILSLARDSFFADDGRLRESLKDEESFLHTEKIVLVDGDGRLRGVYNGSQRFDLDHLVDDAILLLGQK
jgi:protein SCO1/2